MKIKLEVLIGRDVDDDFALDITLTIGSRQYVLGLFAMYTIDLAPNQELELYVTTREEPFTS